MSRSLPHSQDGAWNWWFADPDSKQNHFTFSPSNDPDLYPPDRQQRERLRQMEAAADEERRRKQAEQQEQLEGLYRQQEAALRKKRGGAGIPRDESDGRSDDREDFRAPPYDMPALRSDTGHLLGIGCLLYTSPSPRDGLLSRMPSSA